MRINYAELNDWLKNQSVRYASMSVPTRPGGTQLARLVFDVRLAGGYAVSWGNEALYDGDDYEAAAEAFNDIAAMKDATATAQRS